MIENEKILLIRLGALGDLILCSDAFARCRAAFPKAHIALLTQPKFSALARLMPWFDEIIEDPKPKAGAFKDWLILARSLRRFSPNTVFDFQAKLRTNLYRRLLPSSTNWISAEAYKPLHTHMADWLSACLTAASVPLLEASWDWLKADLQTFSLPERYGILITGSAPQHPQKRWPAEHFAALSHLLATEGLATLLIGTAAEAEANAKIKALAPHAQDLTGKTDLPHLASLMRGATYVVGNDTGPTHLAAKIGTPTLMVMGGYTDPARSHPRGKRANFIRVESLPVLRPEQVWARVKTL